LGFGQASEGSGLPNLKPTLSLCLGLSLGFFGENVAFSLLYNFKRFISHVSQPIWADTSNNFFSILVVFGDLLEKLKKLCGDKSFEIVQYLSFLRAEVVWRGE